MYVFVNLCMRRCIHAFIYVYMYARMYLFMHGLCIYVGLDVCIYYVYTNLYNTMYAVVYI